MSLADTNDVFVQGCELYKTGKLEEALQNFDAILENNPTHFDTLSMKSKIFSKLGKYHHALEECNKALAVEPKDIVMLNNKALLESNLGNHKAALEIFENLEKKQSQNTVILFNKALCLSRMQKYEDAVRYYDKVLSMQPYNYDALYNKANDLVMLGKYDQALFCYDLILKKNPSDTRTIHNKSVCQSKQKHSSKQEHTPNKILNQLQIWIELGRPTESPLPKKFPVNLLPQNDDEALQIIAKMQKWIDNGMTKFDDTDKKDKKLIELASAMLKFEKASHKSKTKSKLIFLGIPLIVILFFYMNPLGIIDFSNLEIDYIKQIPTLDSVSTASVQTTTGEFLEHAQILEQLFNQKRQEVGRGQLHSDHDLTSLALIHAADMAKTKRLDRALSSDGLPVTTKYANKLDICISNAQSFSDSVNSAVNVYYVPSKDQVTPERIISDWLDNDVRELIIRNPTFQSIGTGIATSDDGSLYVSQIYC